MRQGVLPSGVYHRRPLWNVGRAFNVGGGDAKRAIEGTGEYEDIPGARVPPVKLEPGVLAIPYKEPHYSGTEKEDVMARKTPKYPSHQEAVQIRYEFYREKKPPYEIMAAHNVSWATVHNITEALGKWSYFLDQPVATNAVRLADDDQPGGVVKDQKVVLPVNQGVAIGQAMIAPPPSQMGAVGVAMEAVGITPNNAPIKTEPLLVNTLRWQWGRDRRDMHLAHCWREYEPQPGVDKVKSLCGRIIPISEASRLIRDTSHPHCAHCSKSFSMLTSAESHPHHIPEEVVNKHRAENNGLATAYRPIPIPHPTETPNMERIEEPKPVLEVTDRPTSEAPEAPDLQEAAVEAAPPVRRKRKQGPKPVTDKWTAWLKDRLKDGPVESEVVKAEGEAFGVSRDFLRHIKLMAGIKHSWEYITIGEPTFPHRRETKTWWFLPEHADRAPGHMDRWDAMRDGKEAPPKVERTPRWKPPEPPVMTPDEAPLPLNLGTDAVPAAVPAVEVSPMVRGMFELVLKELGGDLSAFGFVKANIRRDEMVRITIAWADAVAAQDLANEALSKLGSILAEVTHAD